MLEQPGVLARSRAAVRAAQGDQPYWSGKVVRTYLTSTLWNLRHRRPGRALQRLAYGLVSLALAGPYLLRPAFWRAVLKPHAGLTHAAGFLEKSQPAPDISA